MSHRRRPPRPVAPPCPVPGSAPSASAPSPGSNPDPPFRRRRRPVRAPAADPAQGGCEAAANADKARLAMPARAEPQRSVVAGAGGAGPGACGGRAAAAGARVAAAGARGRTEQWRT